MHNPPPIPSFQALTVKSNGGRLLRIVTEIGVSLPYVPSSGSQMPEIHRTLALWDTGASGSVITKTTASALALVPTSMARMAHAGGFSDVNGYLVNFYLPNQVNISNIKVMEMEDSQEFGVLIGMDVITMGDFAITNVQGNTVVSFRYPSIAEIDYVLDSDKLNSAARRTTGVGRNEPCPCGSGRKYKNCHGR